MRIPAVMTALVVLSVAVVVLLAFVTGSGPPVVTGGHREELPSRADPLEAQEVIPIPDTPRELLARETERANESVPAPDPVEEPGKQAEELKRTIRYALETSISGGVDLDAFVDIALYLSSLEVDPRAFAEPDIGGGTRFALKETLDGVSAELVVMRTSNPDFAPNVLSLKVTDEPERDVYYLEGAARKAPEAFITIRTGREGGLKTFGILTSANVNGPATKRLGIAFNEGEIPISLMYSYNVDDPSRNVAYMDGVISGRTARLPRQVGILGDPSQRLADLELLTQRMLTQFASLKR